MHCIDAMCTAVGGPDLASSRSAEAYRRAVDLSPRDYRAWYGLGQTYELLHMPFYALHYFRRATQVRSHLPWPTLHEPLSFSDSALLLLSLPHNCGA